MPLRNSTFLAAAVALLAAWAPSQAGAFTLDDLMARLADAGAVVARYTERRDSPLLAEPVELRGRIRIDPAGSFVKTTEGEDPSTLRMAGDTVTLTRGGETREMRVDGFPAMALLAEGLFALARGDGEALKKRFETELSGDAADWRLALRPRMQLNMDDPSDTEPTGFVRLTVEGSEARFRRMVLEQSAGQRTVMTFRPVEGQ